MIMIDSRAQAGRLSRAFPALPRHELERSRSSLTVSAHVKVVVEVVAIVIVIIGNLLQ